MIFKYYLASSISIICSNIVLLVTTYLNAKLAFSAERIIKAKIYDYFMKENIPNFLLLMKVHLYQ